MANNRAGGAPWLLISGVALAVAIAALVFAVKPWERFAQDPPVQAGAPRDIDAEIEAARLAERELVLQEQADLQRQQQEQTARAQAAQEQAARDNADDNAWAVAQRANTRAGYDAYLAAYPNGRHAPRARTARTPAAAPAPAPAAAPPTPTTYAAYDLAQLNPLVRAAVESARAAESRANAAAQRARSAATTAEDAARRARAGEAGHRVFTDGTGVRYEGAWTNGAAFGAGVRHASPTGDFAGDRYAGNFANGYFTGAGVYYFSEARRTSRHEGEWSNSERVGPGVSIWRSGERFAGDWRANAISGFGVRNYADGVRYEGAWANNARNGHGVEWSAQGRVLQAGLWRDGNLVTPLSR